MTNADQVRDLSQRIRLVVAAGDRSSRPARVAVHEVCRHASLGAEVSEVAALLVSELVSNVLEHAGGPAVVEVDLDARRLRVSVADDDPTVPAPGVPTTDDERGRGLLLVATLATRWGVTPLDGGKVVWFEIDRP